MNTPKSEYGEPWKFSESKRTVFKCDSNKVFLDEEWGDGSFPGKENLERVIACVNFCAGVPSDALKPFGLASSFRPLTPGGQETQVLEEQKELNALYAELMQLKMEVAAKNLILKTMHAQAERICSVLARVP